MDDEPSLPPQWLRAGTAIGATGGVAHKGHEHSNGLTGFGADREGLGSKVGRRASADGASSSSSSKSHSAWGLPHKTRTALTPAPKGSPAQHPAGDPYGYRQGRGNGPLSGAVRGENGATPSLRRGGPGADANGSQRQVSYRAASARNVVDSPRSVTPQVKANGTSRAMGPWLSAASAPPAAAPAPSPSPTPLERTHSSKANPLPQPWTSRLVEPAPLPAPTTPKGPIPASPWGDPSSTAVGVPAATAPRPASPLGAPQGVPNVVPAGVSLSNSAPATPRMADALQQAAALREGAGEVDELRARRELLERRQSKQLVPVLAQPSSKAGKGLLRKGRSTPLTPQAPPKDTPSPVPKGLSDWGDAADALTNGAVLLAPAKRVLTRPASTQLPAAAPTPRVEKTSPKPGGLRERERNDFFRSLRSESSAAEPLSSAAQAPLAPTEAPPAASPASPLAEAPAEVLAHTLADAPAEAQAASPNGNPNPQEGDPLGEAPASISSEGGEAEEGGGPGSGSAEAAGATVAGEGQGVSQGEEAPAEAGHSEAGGGVPNGWAVSAVKGGRQPEGRMGILSSMPEEEEAFLRSLGWEACDEEGEGGLTEEEIASFQALAARQSFPVQRHLQPLSAQ